MKYKQVIEEKLPKALNEMLENNGLTGGEERGFLPWIKEMVEKRMPYIQEMSEKLDCLQEDVFLTKHGDKSDFNLEYVFAMDYIAWQMFGIERTKTYDGFRGGFIIRGDSLKETEVYKDLDSSCKECGHEGVEDVKKKFKAIHSDCPPDEKLTVKVAIVGQIDYILEQNNLLQPIYQQMQNKGYKDVKDMWAKVK